MTTSEKDRLRITHTGYIVEEYRIRVKLADGSMFIGTTNISDYGISRLSELFIHDEPRYIILYHSTRPDSEEDRILFINKDRILWAEPED